MSILFLGTSLFWTQKFNYEGMNDRHGKTRLRQGTGDKGVDISSLLLGWGSRQRS